MSTAMRSSTRKSFTKRQYDHDLLPLISDVHVDTRATNRIMIQPRLVSHQNNRTQLDVPRKAGLNTSYPMIIMPGAAAPTTKSLADDSANNFLPDTTQDGSGDFVVWEDNTGVKVSLNIQNGVIQRQADVTQPWPASKENGDKKRPTRSTRVKGRHDFQNLRLNNGWLETFLSEWTNPKFSAGDLRLPCLIENDDYGEKCFSARDQSGGRIMVSQDQNLTNIAFGRAQVIAQLDAQFILLKVKKCKDLHLVLVDQHAASERVIVEDLMQDICKHCEGASLEVRSNLGLTSSIKTTELQPSVPITTDTAAAAMCKASAPFLARWGVLFDFEKHIKPVTLEDGDGYQEFARLRVLTLPALVAERFATDHDAIAQLVIGTAHQRWQGGILKDFRYTSSANHIEDLDSLHWLRQIGTCPAEILQALNSRACRSAIMFNDELSDLQCKELISKLGRCAFPLLCAHGRPLATTCARWSSLQDETQSNTCSWVEGEAFEDRWRHWTNANTKHNANETGPQ